MRMNGWMYPTLDLLFLQVPKYHLRPTLRKRELLFSSMENGNPFDPPPRHSDQEHSMLSHSPCSGRFHQEGGGSKTRATRSDSVRHGSVETASLKSHCVRANATKLGDPSLVVISTLTAALQPSETLGLQIYIYDCRRQTCWWRLHLLPQ